MAKTRNQAAFTQAAPKTPAEYAAEAAAYERSIGIPENDLRPYIHIEPYYGRGSILVPVEGSDEDVQMKIWEQLDRYGADSKFNASIQFFHGNASHAWSSGPRTEGDIVAVLQYVSYLLQDRASPAISIPASQASRLTA